MSLRQTTLLGLLSLLPLAAGCDGDDCCYDSLPPVEEAFLTEDVTDLMSNVFATGEGAYFGDAPLLTEITQFPDPSNRYTVVYLLPDFYRPGLGQGSGDVALQVTEDGVVSTDPLAFSFGTTTALTVEVVYDIVYLGMTPGARETDIALRAILTATRASPTAPFLVEYFVDGTCFFGTTFTDTTIRFRAPGAPSSGIEGGVGEGNIDDPDVYDIFFMEIDFQPGAMRVRGDVGCCAYYDEDFYYDDFFF